MLSRLIVGQALRIQSSRVKLVPDVPFVVMIIHLAALEVFLTRTVIVDGGGTKFAERAVQTLKPPLSCFVLAARFLEGRAKVSA